MLSTRSKLLAAAMIVALQSISMSEASAHCFVGGRFLPATLNTDDPCVADEMSLPTVSSFKTGDDPSAREIDLSYDFSKRITENFGITVSHTWSHIAPPGMPSPTGEGPTPASRSTSPTRSRTAAIVRW